MTGIARREQWRSACGAAAGVLFAGLLCRAAAQYLGWSPWLVAPIGASAVLVFALPSSPLAQPWPVMAGNSLSAAVGVLVAATVQDPVWAGAIAVGMAMLLMFLLRCLHPPGGAIALLAVLAQASSLRYPFFPVMVDSALLVLAGFAYNTLTGRPYPHRVAASPPPASRFTQSDIDAAIARHGQLLDLGRDDLMALLEAAEAHAYGRTLGRLRCGDVMSAEPVTADYAMPLQEAWRILRERRIKALPVVDSARRLLGIVTIADFMRHANLDATDGLAERLREFLRPRPGLHTDKPEVVGDVMARDVGVVGEDESVASLLQLFAEAGHHHVPVVDADRRLRGIVTPSDLIRAVLRAGP